MAAIASFGILLKPKAPICGYGWGLGPKRSDYVLTVPIEPQVYAAINHLAKRTRQLPSWRVFSVQPNPRSPASGCTYLMEFIYFTNLACRRAYRAVYAHHSGRLYVELLAPTDYSPSPTHWEPTCEADLGRFGCFDLALLSTVAAGAVELGRAVFYALA